MGFSLSGSLALLLLAFFVASGLLVSAGANGFEHVRDAYRASNDDRLHQANTAIDIRDTGWEDPSIIDGDEYLAMNVTNNGTRTLRVSDTDILADNIYQSNFTVREVAGDPDTDLWQPGETLYVEINSSTLDTNPLDPEAPPDRVKVASAHGVADTAEVA